MINTSRRGLSTWFAAMIAVACVMVVLPAPTAGAVPVSVSGNVSLGTTGNHPGELVFVNWDKDEGARWSSGPLAGVDTLANGDYQLSLEPGTYRLRFSSHTGDYLPRYLGGGTSADSAVLVTVGTTPITGSNITLPNAGSISGHVYLGSTALSAGAGDVRVSFAECWSADCGLSRPSSMLTDAAGNYSFPGLWHGRYKLKFTYLSGTGFQPAPLEVVIASTQYAFSSSNVTLAPSASFSGRVYVGTAATPAGSGEVKVTASNNPTGSSWWNYSTVTDSTGAYSIVGLPSGYFRLHFDYVGTSSYADEWYADQIFPNRATITSLTSTNVVRDATLAPGATINGLVTDFAGTTLQDVTVQAFSEDPVEHTSQQVAAATTGADGRYSLRDLPAASYNLRFVPSSGFVAPSGLVPAYYGSDPLQPEDTAPVSVTVGAVRANVDQTLYRPTRLSGTVSCTCDMALLAPSLGVALQRNSSLTATPNWVEFRYTSVQAANGNPQGALYDIRDLPPGSYRLQVVGRDGVAPDATYSAVVALADGDDVVVNLPATFSASLQRDFSGDGKADVLVRTPTGVLRQYAGNGNSGWLGASNIGSGWSSMNHVFSAGDFSGDGKIDVMARDGAGNLWLYRGNGAGGWGAVSKVGTGWARMTAIFSPGDFDGDGKVDVIARDVNGDLHLYRGNGSGGWGTVSRIGSGWNTFNVIYGSGDFNGDGKADVMARDGAGNLYLYRGNGSGGWLGGSIVGRGWAGFTAIIGASDFSGDGKADVMARDGAGNLYLYRGNGTGGWGAVSRIGTGWNGLLLLS